jgi:hypothetical protein
MLPTITHPIWKEIVLGKKQFQFRLLAAKIMMSRILLSTKNDPSPQNVDKCVNEVYEFFVKNEKIAQNDIKQMLG